MQFLQNLYYADTWEGPEGVRLIEVSLYVGGTEEGRCAFPSNLGYGINLRYSNQKHPETLQSSVFD